MSLRVFILHYPLSIIHSQFSIILGIGFNFYNFYNSYNS